MKITSGTTLSIKHYANDIPLKGKVLSCSDTSLSIHIPGKNDFGSFAVSDPLVLSFSSNQKVYIVSALVTAFDAAKKKDRGSDLGESQRKCYGKK